MNIWRSSEWIRNGEVCSQERRRGLRFRFQRDVDNNVRRACIDFGSWLRSEFYFPIRVVIYFKSTQYIKACDGELVSATFFGPFSKIDEPYIKISTGDYHEMIEKRGEDNALVAILRSVIHELTHYFQWINDVRLTEVGSEKQASRYGRKILDEYAQTREHP